MHKFDNPKRITRSIDLAAHPSAIAHGMAIMRPVHGGCIGFTNGCDAIGHATAQVFKGNAGEKYRG